jgi:hypothetical protein
MIANHNWLIACSNQLRQGTDGKSTTPGGNAIPYYASLRLQMNLGYPKSKVTRKVRLSNGVERERPVGIISHCKVIKSSIDVPFRECDVYIIFGYGIDDVRANLQWLKDTNKTTSYEFGDHKCKAMEDAIKIVEQEGLEQVVKDAVIDLWADIDERFTVIRKPKCRG